MLVNGAQPTPRSRHLAVVVPTLLLLLPQLTDGGQQQTPQHKQRQFQELVSSGSYAPSYSPNESSELEPPSPPSRLPKSETISNCREVASGQEDISSNNRKITSSFSHTNFKYLKERISTSSLFKPQNTCYMALSNSSESVQEDSEASNSCRPVASNNDLIRTTQSVYTLPLLLDGNNKRPAGTANKNIGNNRLYVCNRMSMPNFQRIQNLELRGLMEDLSDSSSNDIPSRCGVTGTSDNQAYSETPKKPTMRDTVVIANRNQRITVLHNSNAKVKSDGEAIVDNEAFCQRSSQLPGMVTQDSLESIPDIKDFISPDIGTGKFFQDDSGSLKLIDFDDDNCCGDNGKDVTSKMSVAKDSFTAQISSQPVTPVTGIQPSIPKSFSCFDNNMRCRKSLPVVNENFAWDSHKDYATCLNTTVVTPDGYKRGPNVEMKTFPRLPDFDEGISEDIFFENPFNSENFGVVDEPSPVENGYSENEPSPVISKEQQQRDSNKPNNKEQQNNNVTTINNGKHHQNSRHFSMLILGGREQGVNGCGRRPITIWKLDFWK